MLSTPTAAPLHGPGMKYRNRKAELLQQFFTRRFWNPLHPNGVVDTGSDPNLHAAVRPEPKVNNFIAVHQSHSDSEERPPDERIIRKKRECDERMEN